MEVFRIFRYENGGFLLGILVLQNAAKQLCGIEDTEFGAVFCLLGEGDSCVLQFRYVFSEFGLCKYFVRCVFVISAYG